jgi:hypothetical protein
MLSFIVEIDLVDLLIVVLGSLVSLLSWFVVFIMDDNFIMDETAL